MPALASARRAGAAIPFKSESPDPDSIHDYVLARVEWWVSHG